MARDDANGSGGNGPWDFDLPDLGASTTPGHHRTGASESDVNSGRERRDQEPAAPRNAHRGKDREGERDEVFDVHQDRYEEPEFDREPREPRRHSPEVYRRRRLVAGVLALLLVVGLGFGLSKLIGGGDAESDPVVAAEPTNSDPFAGYSARPESQASDGASGPAAMACGDDLKVTASTDEKTYSGKDKPVLIMTLENTGKDECMVNAGTARMDFTVNSGQDKVFDSAHCQIDGQDRPITLDAGEKESARFEWDRHRSVPDCATEGSAVQAGTYRLTVTLGEDSSEGVEFTLE